MKHRLSIYFILTIFTISCSNKIGKEPFFKLEKGVDFNNLIGDTNQKKASLTNIEKNGEYTIISDDNLIIKPRQKNKKSLKSMSSNNAVFTNSAFYLSEGEALNIVFSTKLNTPKDKNFAIQLINGNDSIVFHLEQNNFSVLAKNKNYIINLKKAPETITTYTLYLERFENTKYRWIIAYGDNHTWNEFNGSPTESENKLGGFSASLLNNKELIIRSFAKGKINSTRINKINKAIQLPFEKEKPNVYLKYDTKQLKGTEKLIINGIKGKVTKEELNGLNEYFIKRPLLTTNYRNTIFASWTKAYMMEWVYNVKKDMRLLNRMIEQSESLLNNRDFITQKYKTRLSDSVVIYTPGWSHFRGITFHNNEPVKEKLGIATLGTGINYPAATARVIAKNPEIWNKKYKGKTYKEIAYNMLESIHESWDFVIEHYHDEKSNLLLSPPEVSEPEGYVPQWNRIFPLMSAGNTLVDTYELFDDKNSKSILIDTILKSLFKSFWENSSTEITQGKEVLLFPYGNYRLVKNKNHTEDGGHFGFDLRGFRVFHESGRYWNEKQTQLLANVLNLNVIQDNKGTFSKRLRGNEGVTKNYSYWGAIPPMIWLTEFEPKLEEKLVKYAIKLMNKRNSLDGRVVFHTLHLRAKKYGIE